MKKISILIIGFFLFLFTIQGALADWNLAEGTLLGVYDDNVFYRLFSDMSFESLKIDDYNVTFNSTMCSEVNKNGIVYTYDVKVVDGDYTCTLPYCSGYVNATLNACRCGPGTYQNEGGFCAEQSGSAPVSGSVQVDTENPDQINFTDYFESNKSQVFVLFGIVMILLYLGSDIRRRYEQVSE